LGSEIIVLLLVPITAMVLITMMFGTHDNSPVIQDIDLITGLLGASADRDICIADHPECSNVGCSLIVWESGEVNIFGIDFGDIAIPHFQLCGDLFYTLLIIVTVLSVPFLSVGIPILLMLPVLNISMFGYTYDLADFWFIYAPMWGMTTLGVSKIIW